MLQRPVGQKGKGVMYTEVGGWVDLNVRSTPVLYS